MEKIIISYKGTGIRSLYAISGIMLWLSVIGIFVAIFVIIILNDSHKVNEAVNFATIAIVSLIITFTLSFICKALSVIADNSLYQKKYLEYKALHKEEIIFEEEVNQ